VGSFPITTWQNLQSVEKQQNFYCTIRLTFQSSILFRIIRDEPWPNPTWAYCWPAVNKRPTWLWPAHFLTRPDEIFFDPNLRFLGEIFKTQTQTKDGWSNPARATKLWPYPTRVKNFWPRPIITDSAVISIVILKFCFARYSNNIGQFILHSC